MKQVHDFSDLPYSEDESEDLYKQFLVSWLNLIFCYYQFKIVLSFYLTFSRTKFVIYRIDSIDHGPFQFFFSKISSLRGTPLAHNIKFQNKKFTVNKFLLHNETIPDIADGTYKCYLFIYKGMEVINAIYVMLRLY